MSSKTRKRPYSQDLWRAKQRSDGSVGELQPQMHGYQTNPSTGKPSPGPSGAIRRANDERQRVLDRAQMPLRAKAEQLLPKKVKVKKVSK